jgi:hypothetical protein
MVTAREKSQISQEGKHPVHIQYVHIQERSHVGFAELQMRRGWSRKDLTEHVAQTGSVQALPEARDDRVRRALGVIGVIGVVLGLFACRQTRSSHGTASSRN